MIDAKYGANYQICALMCLQTVKQAEYQVFFNKTLTQQDGEKETKTSL